MTRRHASHRPGGRSADTDVACGEARSANRPSQASRAWLIGLTAAALAIKMAVTARLAEHPLLQPQGELDTAYYVELGRTLARDGWTAGGVPFFVAPLYVYFLALVFKASAGSLLAARLVQIVLGAAAVPLLHWTARHWFGEAAARIAAVVYLLCGFVTFSEVILLQSALDPFLAAATLYWVTRAQAGGGYLLPAAAGVTAGLFALNRPNAIAYGVAAGALLALRSWRRAGGGRRAIVPAAGRAAIFFAGLALAPAANALRNYAASGEAVLISSHGGLNFFMGNHAGADGTYQAVAGLAPSVASQARDAARLAEEATGRKMSAGEISNYYYRLALDWIAGHPADALRLQLRKIAILVNKTDVSLNYSYAYYRGEPTLLRFLFVGPWLLMPLGLVGLWWNDRRPRDFGYWAWASFIPIYGLSVAAFFVADRYRLPLLPVLCVTSAAALVRLVGCVRNRKAAGLALPLVVLAGAFTATGWDLGLNDGLEEEQARRAVWLVRQGSYAEAREYVAGVPARGARRSLIHFRYGEALAAAGRDEDAIAEFRRALEISPEAHIAALSLAQALARTGRPEEAVPHLVRIFDAGYERQLSGPLLVWALASAGQVDEAVRRLSAFPEDLVEQYETAVFLGDVALEGGKPREAERWLRLAAARRPEQAKAHFKLGAALLMQERPQEAVAPLERAVRLEPRNGAARRNLALAYAGCNRFAEARAQAQEALRLDPSDVQLRALLRSLPR